MARDFLSLIHQSMREKRTVEIPYDRLIFDEMCRHAKAFDRLDTVITLRGSMNGWPWSVCFLGLSDYGSPASEPEPDPGERVRFKPEVGLKGGIRFPDVKSWKKA